MEESIFSKNIYDNFTDNFPDGWIDNLFSTGGKEKESLGLGIAKISDFEIFVFSNASRLVLSGDFLICNIEKLTELESKIEGNLQDTLSDNSDYRATLFIKYNNLLYFLHIILKSLCYHISQVKDRFSVNSKSITLDAISFLNIGRPNDQYIKLFDMVCEICFMEYYFSYDENYITKLLVKKEILEKISKVKSGEIKLIIEACLMKVELILSKLSCFSKQRRINYNFDFEPKAITLSEPDKYTPDDFRHLYLKYLDPERLDYSLILSWQNDSLKEDVSMWQLAFLMRYYTKITKSQEQIDNLIRLSDKHHYEYLQGKDHNLINDCADRSFRNYMYNSRFSFILNNSNDLTLDDIKNEIATIESVQHDTFFYNYHPYLKAVEYLFVKIDNLLREEIITRDLEVLNNLLQKCYLKLKENYEWCKHHQPYFLQLRYRFSTIDYEMTDIKVFCPCSICRPIRYKMLKEIIDQLNIKVSLLDYQVRHIDEHRKLIQAKSKIDSMERKNIEHMGVFMTVTTFLVGLLSIFTGGDKTSITVRMGYVFALGLILLSFVCLGYFLVTERFKRSKPWIFGSVGILILTIFVILVFHF